MNFYKRHLGDIAKSCGDLSQGQMGAYDLLLDWHYANEKSLPSASDKLYRIGRAVTATERANVDSVLAELFILSDAGYTHKRAAEEMAKANAQAVFNRAVGRLGGRPKKKETVPVIENNPCGFENVTENNPSQTPDSRLQKKEQRPPADKSASFDSFWTAYPNKKGLKLARKAWDRDRLAESLSRILSDVEARKRRDPDWQRGAIPHGSTYLNQARWLDALAPDALPAAGPATNPGGISPRLSPEEEARRKVEALAEMRRQYPEMNL